MSHKVIPIKEDFDHPQGQFLNYDAYDTAQRFALPKQKHIDIRNFEPGEERAFLRMIQFDLLTMNDVDGLVMTDLESEVILFLPEIWSAGIVDYQTDRNNWKGLTLTLSAGLNTTESVLQL